MLRGIGSEVHQKDEEDRMEGVNTSLDIVCYTPEIALYPSFSRTLAIDISPVFTILPSS